MWSFFSSHFSFFFYLTKLPNLGYSLTNFLQWLIQRNSFHVVVFQHLGYTDKRQNQIEICEWTTRNRLREIRPNSNYARGHHLFRYDFVLNNCKAKIIIKIVRKGVCTTQKCQLACLSFYLQHYKLLLLYLSFPNGKSTLISIYF